MYTEFKNPATTAVFRGGGEKDGCLTSRESGMEACVQLSREIFPGEVIHITSVSLLSVIGVVGAIASIVSLALYLYDRHHDKKEK